MSPEKQAEYDRLTQNCYQMQMDIAALEAEPQVYGYARVSTQGQARDGNSLADQTAALTAAGAVKVYSDAYTGWEKERPGLDELLSVLREGDTVVVTKLDRMARSTVNGLQLIQELTERGVTVNNAHGRVRKSRGNVTDITKDASRSGRRSSWITPLLSFRRTLTVRSRE